MNRPGCPPRTQLLDGASPRSGEGAVTVAVLVRRTRFFSIGYKDPVDLPTGVTRLLAVDMGVINSGRCNSPAQREKMGVFGTPKARFHDKNHAATAPQLRHRPSTKHLCCGPKRNQDTIQDGRCPTRQVMACGACLTNTYQSRMAWRWHAYRWPEGDSVKPQIAVT